jgi:S-DNA-T family DNA segregation ATPase FtsK/SpoIIIE
MKNKTHSSNNKFNLLLSGLILLAAASIFIISLATFDINDPSFNNISENTPKNFLGIFGAYSADLLLQLFGLGAFFLILIPFIWGLQNVFKYESHKFFSKFISYLCSLVIFLSILSSIQTEENWVFISYGGSLGNLMYVYINNSQFEYAIYLQIIGFLATLYFALGFKLATWKATLLNLHYYMTIFFKNTWYYSKILASKTKELFLFIQRKTNPPAPILINEVLIPEDNEPLPSPIMSSIIEIEKPKEEIDNFIKPIKTHHKDKFQLPAPSLLNKINAAKKVNLSKKILEENAQDLSNVLQDFGVRGEITGYYPGPVVTLFELEPAAGTKSSRIVGLADDIARTMCSTSARIAVIPGKNSIGIELPNETREIVYLRELIEDKIYQSNNFNLPLILGKDISGNSIIVDLASMPHLLVAGTTGSGKSVAINTMILSLLYKLTPDECKFIMIDPKMLELSVYDGIPHLLAPVVTEPNKAITALKWVVREMENRYRLMSNLSVRNIEGYNHKIKEAIDKNLTIDRQIQTGFDPATGKPIYETVEIEKKPLPFIVVIVDEMADLMIVAGKEIESSIQRLAQMARAAGIHIIMATQRPSVDVITGVIKANFPTRISFHVTSKIDSRTILGEMGAEQLLGKGDMLYMSGGSKIKRVHGPFVEDSEVENVVKFLKNQSGPNYSVDITSENDNNNMTSTASSGELDELYQEAVELVIREQKASTSYLQRYFKIGYNRAATIIEQMEKNGVVGPANHVGKRDILINQTEKA